MYNLSTVIHTKNVTPCDIYTTLKYNSIVNVNMVKHKCNGYLVFDHNMHIEITFLQFTVCWLL